MGFLEPGCLWRLHKGLSALAQAVDLEMPAAKAFDTHGSPVIREVPLFHHVSHCHSSSSSSSLTLGYTCQHQFLKQIRRLQDIISHTSKLLNKFTP
eukprot:12426983-Karenia_brevis.AAC.1